MKYEYVDMTLNGKECRLAMGKNKPSNKDIGGFPTETLLFKFFESKKWFLIGKDALYFYIETWDEKFKCNESQLNSFLEENNISLV